MTKQNKKQVGAFVTCIVTLALLTGLVFSALEWWTDKGPSTWGKKKESEGPGKVSAVVEIPDLPELPALEVNYAE